MTMPPVAASDPRSWLLSQPQLLFILFVGAIWLFRAIARARAAISEAARGPQEARGPESADQGSPAGQEPDEEERTRRVRAEILRKIAERRAGALAAQPARVREERLAPEPAPILGTAPGGSRGPAQRTAAAAGFRGTQTVSGESLGGPPAPPPPGGATGPAAGGQWLDDLRARNTVRRAILAREILGPPVALR